MCASPEVLARHGAPRDPRSLAALACVNFGTLSMAAAWAFRAKDGKALIDVPIAPRLSVSTAEAAVWAAARGVGVTRVAHYQCAAAVSEGALRIILADFEPAPLPIHLIHSGRGALPSKTRAFLDFAAEKLRQTGGRSRVF